MKFESDEDYKHLLFEGPWMVADHYLLIQRWWPNFLKNAYKVTKVAVWIRIMELLFELITISSSSGLVQHRELY